MKTNNSHLRYEIEEALKHVAAYSIAFGIIILIIIGSYMLLHRANIKIESDCSAKGGQVITSPAKVSKCILPMQKK